MATLELRAVLPRIVPFPVPGAVAGAISRALGLDQIVQTYDALQTDADDASIAQRLLDYLGVACAVSAKDLEQIPRTGPVVLVANHPFGILDGAVLAALLSRIRPDVRFLANSILQVIPEIRQLLIPVDPAGGACENRTGLRKAIEHLRAGGMLVLFPAGEVSHFQWRRRSVTDPEWNRAASRIVALASRGTTGVSIVPVFIDGANSLLFQVAGVIHSRLRTALLVRELLNKRRQDVEVRVGAPIEGEKLLAIPTDSERTEYLRWRTYLLASRRRFKPQTSLPLSVARRDRLAPVVEAVDSRQMQREIDALDPAAMLGRSGDLAVYLARAEEIRGVLREIGRLREITFRAAGEGTGKALDLDRFDSHYLHLFVWNAARQEVAGAYRLVGTDESNDLYTATLFRYGHDFLDRMGPALELGRSFVRAEYQKAFAPLLLLWKGIGQFVAANPRYRVLFGPVSISNRYQALSRELMVAFLERRASLREWAGLVRQRNPFRARTAPRIPAAGFDIEDLSDVVNDVEGERTGIPVLLRQYLRLGGRLLGFNVDAEFSSALDGLILVDLTQTDPKLLDRYLGKAEAARFLSSQQR